ncbi:serine hydrolase domain-containing protein [Winogradskyella flava]|uniref:Beta-lactamase family protein n=1 Tax=Winogradskyella flava TaxID=1884876 RepID=A0A842ITM7_9FLAO|nr:serine hydrolase domain-containing protein [Winogradskyella flava]MBC2845093.1 beta-lactamase family protein [Winogradskyella flava]
MTFKQIILITLSFITLTINAQKVSVNHVGEIFTRDFDEEKFHEYEVKLVKNEFFLASITDQGIDVKATVYINDGSKLLEFDDNGFNGEFIKINSKHGGTYLIKVEPYTIQNTSGKYSLQIEAIETIGLTKTDRIKQHLKFWESHISEDISGLGLVIIKDGETVLKNTYGKANLEYNIPLSNNSIFDIASLAKQFTGFAIATLVEDHKLALEDDVSKYIPELPDFGVQLKVSDLIYHTSGLRDIGELFDLGAFGNRLTSNKVLEIVSNQKALNFQPGTSHSYSNTGYVLLAVIVERITNQTIGEWSSTTIFNPLQMKNSFVNDNPELVIKNRAVAYNYNKGKPNFRQENGMALIGSSAVYTSMNDITKWLQFLQSNKAEDKRLITMMTTKGKLTNGDDINYGFGLSVSEYNGLKFISHSGATPAGFNTLIGHFPDQKLSFAIFSNTGSINPIEVIGKDIISIFLKDLFEKPLNDLPKQLLDVEATKLLEGHYQFSEDMTVHFFIENDKFYVNANKDIHQLEPIDATNFRLSALDSNIEFILDEENKAFKAIISSGDNIIADMPKVSAIMDTSVAKVTQKKAPLNTERFVGKYYSDELLMSIDVKKRNTKLCLQSSKHGVVPIKHEKENYFSGFGDLEFIIKDDHSVTGFKLTRGHRMKDVYFKKVLF